MPSVMIYIRQQDYDKWQAIKNKPDWLHEHLNKDFNPIMIIDSSKMTMPIHPNLAPMEPTIEPLEESA